MIFPADDLTTEDPRPTALFAAAASASLANSWTSINGWSVARAYVSASEEYLAAAQGVAVADLGALPRYTASGAGAASFLARVTTAPVAGLVAGESARGLMLDDAAAILDIVEVARLAADLYLLTTTRPQARRLQLGLRGFDAVVADVTGRVAALAILGPDARDAAASAGVDLADDSLARQASVRGVELSARPIHFGTLSGFEVIYPAEEALVLWERLRRARAPQPIGLDALEIFRIESGAPRPGVDFLTPHDSRLAGDWRRPAAIGLAHLAPPNSGWFNGRRALARDERTERVLTALSIDAEIALPGDAVFRGKTEIGRISSAAFSPQLRGVVAIADLPGELRGADLEVKPSPGGGHRVAARLLETPESRLAAAFRAAHVS